VRTIIRNIDWQNDLSLYQHDNNIQNNFLIDNNIGWYFQQHQNLPQAIKYYKKSVDAYPFSGSINNLALTYELVGEKKQALKYFYKLFKSQAYSTEEHHRSLNYAAYLILDNHPPETAKDFINKALNANPTSGPLWAYLTVAEYRLNNYEEALKAAEKAKSISDTTDFNNLYLVIKQKEILPRHIKLFL
jgi:tetratricopeptide (TPR) repeat protein